jgi:hypothetical protein
LLHSAKATHQPISWAEDAVPAQIKNVAQEKKISDIKNLNPFQCKVKAYSLQDKRTPLCTLKLHAKGQEF